MRFLLRGVTATLAFFSLLLAVGCEASPPQAKARILRTDIEPVRADGALQALRFQSQIELGDVGRATQILYVVALVDRNGHPVRSDDGRYEIGDGQVAAARTAAVAGGDVVTMKVAIPADELALREEHLPASAIVRVYRGASELLARESCPVPLRTLAANQ